MQWQRVAATIVQRAKQHWTAETISRHRQDRTQGDTVCQVPFLRLSVAVTESCSDVLGSGTPKALFGL